MIAPQKFLTDEMVARIEALAPRYPNRRALTLPALHIVNAALHHVPLGAVAEIAALLGLAPAEVQDTLTFYQFFHQEKPHGEVRAFVCRSLSCALRGGDQLLEQLCQAHGIEPYGTTADGRLTIEPAECLGACDFAPCILANDDLLRNMTPEAAAAELGKPRARAT
ncbi:MAG: NAD(P)H-dependent oxidoreductase subunit E [Planctomycetia bacterium]|jgi:NADH-quinone oxidoreductase subunit E